MHVHTCMHVSIHSCVAQAQRTIYNQTGFVSKTSMQRLPLTFKALWSDVLVAIVIAKSLITIVTLLHRDSIKCPWMESKNALNCSHLKTYTDFPRTGINTNEMIYSLFNFTLMISVDVDLAIFLLLKRDHKWKSCIFFYMQFLQC